MQSFEPAPASTFPSAPAPQPAVPLEPTRSSERIVTLDVLRGIALFGVLTANIWLWFSGIQFLFPGVRAELGRLSLDSAAFMFVSVFISGKAIRTFSFLFGLGFALQLMRAEARGRTVAPTYMRRLSVLLVFGAAHAVLLWYGDILFAYALLGFGLLLFRHRTQQTVLVWAVIMLFIPILLASVPLVRSVIRGRPNTEAADTMRAQNAEHNKRMLTAFGSAEPGQVVRANLTMWRRMYISPLAIFYAHLFGFFLLGLYAGRMRLFEHAMTYRRQMRFAALVGIPIGIVLAFGEGYLRMKYGGPASSALPWFPLVFSAIDIFSATPFALGYIAAATLLLEHARWRRLLGTFAPVGRMALSNYLSQTLICLAIFYAGGLFGHFRPALNLIIAIAIFAVQMRLSAWWLARFRFGPMEWLWRSLTYGEMQPMRIPRLTPVEQPV